MSLHAVEMALFDIASGPRQAASYRADPERFLSGYRLHPDEARLILDMDVRAMAGLPINPMLTMRAFTAVEGRQGVPEYMRRMRPRAA